MAGTAGWYTGLVDVGSVADVKAGTAQTTQAITFDWTNSTVRPTVATANITGLAQITGGPYATKAAAAGAAAGTSVNGLPGTGKNTSVGTGTVNSANGHLPSVPFASWAQAVTGALSALVSGNLWIRVAKVIMGGALVIIGLAHMTGADNSIAQLARKVPVPV